MRLYEAQADVRRAYVGGGPGVLVSAAVWLATAWAERGYGAGPAFAVLFAGGAAIFPASLAMARTVWRRRPPVAGNSLGTTALESTVAMIGGLFAAWLFLPIRPALVLPLAAVAVGTHYLVFRTVYGDRTFWLLGAAVAGAGVMAIVGGPGHTGLLPLAVALIETAFGSILLATDRRRA